MKFNTGLSTVKYVRADAWIEIRASYPVEPTGYRPVFMYIYTRNKMVLLNKHFKIDRKPGGMRVFFKIQWGKPLSFRYNMDISLEIIFIECG